MGKIWGPIPPQLAIVEVLEKKGATTDTELLKEVEDAYGEMSFRELNGLLLKLEVTGVVRVSRLMKGKRRVELVHRVTST
jgi:DNA-binding PadR family transcriptional regulator